MSIADNIRKIKSKIGSSELIAVSKTFDESKVRSAFAEGIRSFGENYLEEAVPKIDSLKDLKEISWHYLGRIQTKKIPKLVRAFDYLHSLESIKHLEKIDSVASENNLRVNLLIQLRHEADQRDYGVLLSDLEGFLRQGSHLKSINLRGLMFLPPAEFESGELQESFDSVRTKFKENTELCRSKGHSWDMISMGMSEDYELAVNCGSTHVRIGRGVFGQRQAKI